MGGSVSIEDYSRAKVVKQPEDPIVLVDQELVFDCEKQIIITDKPIEGKPEGFKAIDKANEEEVMLHVIIDVMKDQTTLMKGNKKIADLKHKDYSLHLQTFITDANDHVIAVTRKAHFLQMHAEASCWLLDKPTPIAEVKSDEIIARQPDIIIKGNWRAKHMLFFSRGMHVIGKCHRCKSKLRNLFDKDVYTCRFSPNIDLGLMMMLVLVLDGMYQDHKN